MTRLLILGVAMSLVVATSACAEPVVIDEREFSQIGSEMATNIKEAMEDFDAVAEGRRPVHAKADAQAPLPLDGGTTYYLGRGYKLTILKSLASIGGVDGYFYGPNITFDEKTVVGNTQQVSLIKFYSLEAFKKLQK